MISIASVVLVASFILLVKGGDVPAACLFLISVIALVIGIKMLIAVNNDDNKREAGCSIDKNGVLKISERKPAIAKVVKIVNDKNYTVSYEPEKIHIGAVTVGGVTTGGAYKTGGYHYVSGSEKSGKCKLVYFGETIWKIQLNDELFNRAKSSSISKYLIEEKKQIQVIKPVYYTESETRMMYNNLSSSGYMDMGAGLRDKAKQGYPTYDKCKEIMNWICGVN